MQDPVHFQGATKYPRVLPLSVIDKMHYPQTVSDNTPRYHPTSDTVRLPARESQSGVSGWRLPESLGILRREAESEPHVQIVEQLLCLGLGQHDQSPWVRTFVRITRVYPSYKHS